MENTIGDTFKCKNICILYFQPNIYMTTLTSCQVHLLGHWAPRNFTKKPECFSSSNSFWNANKSLRLTWGSAHSLLSMCVHWRALFLLPCLRLDRPEISTQLYDYRGGSGHPKSVTWVTNILTAEMGPKLGVTKSTFLPVLSKVLWMVTDRKCGALKVPGRGSSGISFPGESLTLGPALGSLADEGQSGHHRRGKWRPGG